MSDRKRPHEGAIDTSNKKLKRSASRLQFHMFSAYLSGADLIAQKRAEISAKLAAMRGGVLGGGTATKPAAGVAAPVPIVAKQPGLPPKMVASRSPSISSGPTPATGSPAPGTPIVVDDLARKVAEAKRRVAEAQSKLAVKDNPYMSLAQMGKKRGTPVVEQTQQGAGLKMAAHPMLLDQTPMFSQSKKDKYKPMQPKFASIKANTRNIPTPPPAPSPLFLHPDLGTGFEGAPRERAGRRFNFNQKGKYVQLGNQMRQEIQLEDLKQRIAQSARKAGLDGDMGIEKTIKRVPPPEAEWWDVALLPTNKYDDIDTLGLENLNIRTANSPVNWYIQHPIPIPAPGEKSKIALKPMMLTKKEQKKMRKLRRKEALQDKRDLRLANLMKVLTSDAVQDPTRVEARVRREVAMRKHAHEKMNTERKLTDEQRREKVENKKLEEEKKGIYGAVYKVKVLSDPAHQFKVRKNAEQLSLTGVCIFNSQFNLVYVEGAAKFMKNYKRLMLHRMAWTEAARPRGGEDVELEDPDSDVEGDVEGSTSKGKKIDQATMEGKSLEDNKCFLVWEGMLRDRSFSGFKAKSCPTDRDAKDFLGERLKGYWDMAKNWKPEEEELF
ncbi:pre-mRNA processing factor 3-domain-containing protein [Cyathus striatus]|nr:pre-mRNA processing factor 3-domain-containing protein [Cyathus striatus]